MHHASSGCAMNVGDLLGTGTISGPEKDQRGSLLEISWNGTEPIELARRRQAHVPRRRRFAGDARLVPGRRLSRRLRRSRGDDSGGGVISAVIRDASAKHPAPGSSKFRVLVLRIPGMTFEALTLLRRNIPYPRRMRRDIFDTEFQVHPLVRRRLLDDAHARPPLLRRPDRPRRKTAAAVRADIVKLGLDAIRAERAFIGADPRLRRIRRQVLVAIFAVRPKLQRHDRFISVDTGSSQIECAIRMAKFPRFAPCQASSALSGSFRAFLEVRQTERRIASSLTLLAMARAELASRLPLLHHLADIRLRRIPDR